LASSIRPSSTQVALVGLGSLMSELPQGYDSHIGEDGVLLSGGQRQRIGLARAVYGNPQLVVLDEPNASLDEQGDANLLRLLQSLKQAGVTSIVITHRTNVLTVADQILVLKDGSLQAYGPKDQVLAALSPEKNSVVPS
jgi:ATP-binding cassette subfamily C exporter for protease/lipase